MSGDHGIIPEKQVRGPDTIGEAFDRAGFKLRPVKATCSAHGEYEASEMRIGGRPITSYCPACAQADVQREMSEHGALLKRQRDEARQQRITDRLDTAGIPARFKACTFDSFAVDAGAAHEKQQQQALRVCRAFAQRWESVRAKGSVLVMTGPTGTGKTHMACAIANELIREHVAAVTFGTVSEYVRSVKAAFQRDSGVSERDAIRGLIAPDLLIMDELGQRMTEYDQQLVFDVMNARYAEMRPMVLMSNLAANELEILLGDRLADRLREVGTFINLAWPSYRARR